MREVTRRNAGRSLAQVCEKLRPYLTAWKAYFRLAQTPWIFATIDEWIRHSLRALQLKHSKRGPVIYRELRSRGMTDHRSRQLAANSRRWWHNSAKAIHIALPNALFDELGVARLAA